MGRAEDEEEEDDDTRMGEAAAAPEARERDDELLGLRGRGPRTSGEEREDEEEDEEEEPDGEEPEREADFWPLEEELLLTLPMLCTVPRELVVMLYCPPLKTSRFATPVRAMLPYSSTWSKSIMRTAGSMSSSASALIAMSRSILGTTEEGGTDADPQARPVGRCGLLLFPAPDFAALGASIPPTASLERGSHLTTGCIARGLLADGTRGRSAPHNTFLGVY